MLRDNYICALDLGSSKISAVVAEIKKKNVVNAFFAMGPAKGMKQGTILNSIDLIGSIEKIMQALRAKSNINIKLVYVNISGHDIITKHSSAIIPLAERGNKVITPSDIQKVNDQARILGSSLEEEIIHLIPFSYAIDSKNKIINPLGLYSHKLAVDLYLICGKLASIQSLIRAVNQAGCEVKDLLFSGMATAHAVLSQEFRKGQTVIVDIGSDITEMLLFSDGLLRNLEVLPLGGDDMTRKLCDELKIPFDLAEDVKITHASIGEREDVEEQKEILLKKESLYQPIKQRVVIDLVTAKARSMCQTIKEAMEKITPLYQVNNVIATGRTVLLEGFLETLESSLGVPVKLGYTANPNIISVLGKDDTLSRRKYLAYVSALGMVCQALEKEHPQALPDYQPAPHLLAKFVNKVKDVYQEYF